MARTPNDDRSDSKNPNNVARDASQKNHGDQLNPDYKAYDASRSGNGAKPQGQPKK